MQIDGGHLRAGLGGQQERGPAGAAAQVEDAGPFGQRPAKESSRRVVASEPGPCRGSPWCREKKAWWTEVWSVTWSSLSRKDPRTVVRVR